MERRDIRQVTGLLQKYLKRFHLAPSMGEEEVAHWFLPQDNIIDTYVVEVCTAVVFWTNALQFSWSQLFAWCWCNKTVGEEYYGVLCRSPVGLDYSCDLGSTPYSVFKCLLCLCLSYLRALVVNWQISLVSTLCLRLWCITLFIGAWRLLTLFTTFIHKPHYWT